MKTTVISIILFSIAAVQLLYFTSPNNLGFSPDSVQYVQAAEGILAGSGYSIQQPDSSYRAETHWPPFYSTCIAISSIATFKKPIYSVRYLNAFCYGLAVVLLYLIISSMARSHLWGIATALTFAFVMAPSQVYFMALSEGLFNTLLLSALLLLFRYIAKGKGTFLLFLSGILLGFGVVTRFAGIPFIVTFTLIALLSAKTIKQGIANAIAMGLPGFAMFVGLMIRNKLVQDELVSREFIHHSISEAKWQSFFSTFSNWAAPINISFLQLALIVVVITGVILYFKHRSSVKSIWKPLLSVLFISLFYVSFLIFTAMYLDAAMPFNFRILFPLFSLGLLFWGLTGAIVTREFKFGSVLTTLLILAFVYQNKEVTEQHFEEFKEKGSGYTSTYWKNTALFPRVVEKYKNVPIYTNDKHMLYMKCDKLAYLLPKITSITTEKKNDVTDELNSIQNAMEQGAVIVFINKLTYPYLHSEDELNQLLDMDTLESYGYGNIYGIRQ